MKTYRLVITGRGKFFNDLILFESDDLETIETWIENNVIENDEDTKGIMYDLVHDLGSFNTFLEATLTWEYLTIGRYEIKTMDQSKYQY